MSTHDSNNRHPILFDPRRAADMMDCHNLDLLLACRRENVGYLSSCFVHCWQWGGFAHVLALEDAGDLAFYLAGIQREPLAAPFVICHHSRAYCWERSWIRDVRPTSRFGEAPDPVESLVAAIDERGLGGSRIGIEMDHVPAVLWEALRRRLPHATFVDATDVLWHLRMVKTPEELRRLKCAYEVACAVYRRLFERIRPGVSLRELYECEWQTVTEHGCFLPLQHLSFGKVDDQHHTEPDYRVERGDVGFLDLQVVYEGYMTDFGRVAVVGPVPPEVRQLHRFMLEERRCVREILRPGLRACQAAATLIRFDRAHGQTPLPGAGHGLGLECHEWPFLRPHFATPIDEGSVVVIEICRATGGAVLLVEDSGLVTSAGWQPLIDFSTDIVEVAV